MNRPAEFRPNQSEEFHVLNVSRRTIRAIVYNRCFGIGGVGVHVQPFRVAAPFRFDRAA